MSLRLLLVVLTVHELGHWLVAYVVLRMPISSMTIALVHSCSSIPCWPSKRPWFLALRSRAGACASGCRSRPPLFAR
jgi:hypothetical protein